MNQPKFQIGEEVILTSVAEPKLSGEYIVLDVAPTTGIVIGFGGVIEAAIKPFRYRLDVIGLSGNSWWNEVSLRKKHKPSDQSFTELMSSIKSGVVA